jgi:hypothetical protein
MFPHVLLILSFPVCTLAAWAENHTRSFSSFAKHHFQESIGLPDPLTSHPNLTWAASVHPRTVFHPLTYTPEIE